MLTKGEQYTDQGQEYYEQRYRERMLPALSQRTAKLGMKMVAVEQPPPHPVAAILHSEVSSEPSPQPGEQ